MFRVILLLLGFVGCSLGSKHTPDVDVRILSANTAMSCKKHCTALEGCDHWTFDSECVVNMGSHHMVQGAQSSSLLQLGEEDCDMWRDPDCGWVVNTILYGSCELERNPPDSCLGWCSDGCVYLQGVCGASCQPIVEFELEIDPPNLKLLQIAPELAGEIRAELAAFLQVPESQIQNIRISETENGTLRVIFDIVPQDNDVATTDIAAKLVAELTQGDVDEGSFPLLSKVEEFVCERGCGEGCKAGRPQFIGDGYCDWDEDPFINTIGCGFDGGDCCPETCQGDCNVNGYHCAHPTHQDICDYEIQNGVQLLGTVIHEVGYPDFQRITERHCSNVCCHDHECVAFNWQAATPDQQGCELLSSISGSQVDAKRISGTVVARG